MTSYVMLTQSGLSRVIDGAVGMVFEVDSWTNTIAHVRDYRFPRFVDGVKHADYQIWTLGAGQWAPHDLWKLNYETTHAEQDSRQALRDAIFNKICPKGNWKMPIDAWIAPEDFNECNLACQWFTGGYLSVVSTFGSMIQVRSGGYYANIGS